MTDNEIKELNEKAMKVINEIDPTYFDRLYNNKYCDISPEFLGFLDIYYHLSKIIPNDRIIIDLGCAYGIQSIYFLNHKQYVGVDLGTCEQVQTKNGIYFNKGIKHFIDNTLTLFQAQNLFAICSYVPPWYNDNQKLAREHFEHLFVYYPK